MLALRARSLPSPSSRCLPHLNPSALPKLPKLPLTLGSPFFILAGKALDPSNSAFLNKGDEGRGQSFSLGVFRLRVHAAVYAVDIEGVIAPRAEIDRIIWVDPRALPDVPFASLTRDHVLPLARRHGRMDIDEEFKR